MKKLNKSDYVVTEEGKVFTPNGELKTSNVSNGYKAVKICGVKYLVHRLVAEKFIPNPENKPTVNHKDGDKTNNAVRNLEWATYAENNQHAFDALGKEGVRSVCVVNEDVAKIIKHFLKDGVKHQDIANFFGIKKHIIADISAGRSWKNV